MAVNLLVHDEETAERLRKYLDANALRSSNVGLAEWFRLGGPNRVTVGVSSFVPPNCVGVVREPVALALLTQLHGTQGE